MKKNNFITSQGDEFILSIVADSFRERIKNASPYCCRYWTRYPYRLISTNYKFNPVSILHLPMEKEKGMLVLFFLYVHGIMPSNKLIHRICNLSSIDFKSRIRFLLKI